MKYCYVISWVYPGGIPNYPISILPCPIPTALCIFHVGAVILNHILVSVHYRGVGVAINCEYYPSTMLM